MTENNPIIIVGAGPVGMITALALAREGVPVTVLDAAGRSLSVPSRIEGDGIALRPDNLKGGTDGVRARLAALGLQAPGPSLLQLRTNVTQILSQSEDGDPSASEKLQDKMLEDLNTLSKYLDESYDYVMTLEPK